MALVDRTLPCCCRALFAALLVASLPVFVGTAAATEPEGGAWKGSGQLSLLTASGNSRSKSGSLRFELVNEWPEVDRITFTAGALYNESDGEKTSEAEYLNGKYDYFHTPDTYSFYYLGAERDEFAGFDYRATARVGLGHQFIKSEHNTLDGEAGVDYVYEQQQDGSEDFPVGRLYGKYVHKFSEGKTFRQDVEVLENLEEFEDLRVNTLTAFEVAINAHLSFKTALTVKFDGQPALDDDGDPNQKLDYFTETALVFNF